MLFLLAIVSYFWRLYRSSALLPVDPASQQNGASSASKEPNEEKSPDGGDAATATEISGDAPQTPAQTPQRSSSQPSSSREQPEPSTSKNLKQNQGKSKKNCQQGGGGADTAHGTEYHKIVAMLFIIQLFKQAQSEEGFEYRVQLEKHGYMKFDDIIIRYKRKNESWVEICLQCKHKKTKSKLNFSNLLYGNDKNYLWTDYVESYNKIEIDNKRPDEERLYAMVTNNTFDCQSSDLSKPKIKFEKLQSSSAKIFCDIVNCDSYQIDSEYIQEAVKTVKSSESAEDKKCVTEFFERMHLWCTEDTDNLRKEVNIELLKISYNNENLKNNIFNNIWKKVCDIYAKPVEISGDKIKNWIFKGKFLNVPNPCDGFTGRKEQLKEMEIQLKKEKKKKNDIDVVITGTPGMGKTQLALEYANLQKNEYDYILWINATSPETIFSSFKTVADYFKLPEDENKENLNAENLSLKQIQKVYGYIFGNCLYIFDNGEKFLTKRNENKFQLYFPQKKKDIEPQYIVTSTYPAWNSGKMIELKTFEKEEALQFLKSKLDEPEDDLKELSEIFKNWPLALNIASCYIKEKTRVSVHSKFSIKKFLEQYERDPVKVHSESEDWYKYSISNLWKLIKEKINDDENHGENAILFLNIISLCNSDKFPLSIFEIFSDATIMVVVDLSIVQLDKNEGFLDIHCTLQTEIQRSLNEKEQDEALQVGFNIFSNFLKNQNIAERVKLNGARHAVTIFDHVIKMQCEKLGDDHPDTLTSMHYKASVLYNIGKYEEALEIYDHVIKMEKEKLGDDHPSLLTRMHNKALVLDNMGKYEEALEIYDHVIKMRREKLGEDHLGTLRSMHNKAYVLNKLGKYEEALEIYDHVIKIKREKLGDDHPDTLRSMHNKALVLIHMGKYEEALAIYDHVIKMERKKLGDDHPDTLTSMHNKASVFDNTGKHEEALEIYDHVIKMEREKLGDDHPSLLTSMHNKALLLDKMGKYEKALEIYDHVIKMRRGKLGDDHPDTLSSMHNKAFVLIHMGKYEEALGIYDHVIKMERKKLDDDHPDTLTSMHNKAFVLDNMGKYEVAITIYDHVIKMRREKLGDDHPYTLSSINKQAIMLKKMEQNF